MKDNYVKHNCFDDVYFVNIHGNLWEHTPVGEVTMNTIEEQFECDYWDDALKFDDVFVIGLYDAEGRTIVIWKGDVE